MSSFPSRLLLDDVIKRLQAYDKGFNLYKRKKTTGKWILTYSKNGEIVDFYPIQTPEGEDTYTDIRRLKIIAKRYDIRLKVLL